MQAQLSWRDVQVLESVSERQANSARERVPRFFQITVLLL